MGESIVEGTRGDCFGTAFLPFCCLEPSSGQSSCTTRSSRDWQEKGSQFIAEVSLSPD